jgi:hypothetical protein
LKYHLILWAFALGAATCAASVVERMSVEDLSRGADAIVSGRVVAVSSAWNEAHTKIYTFSTVEVTESLKGEPARRIVVKELGGAVGDIGMEASGVARFALGEEVLVFLRRDPDGAYRTRGLAQGKMRLVRETATGRAYADRDLSGLTFAETLERGGPSVRSPRAAEAPARRVYLDELKERIRASLR